MPKLATRPATKAKKSAKAAKKVQPVPAGYHTITPALTVRNASGAIEFYKKALGATLVEPPVACEESGKIMHAALKVGDSIFFLADENPQMGSTATPSSSYLYVKDADAAIAKAAAAGATVKFPAADMFWGDRMGAVTDPFGHSWTIATHTKDLTPAQIKAGQQEFAAKMKAQHSGGCCGNS